MSKGLWIVSRAVLICRLLRARSRIRCRGFILAVWLAGAWHPIAGAAAPDASQSIAQIEQAIRKGNLVEARQQLKSALDSHPRSAELRNMLGVVEAQSGHYSLAETGFREAIRLNPRLTPAYLNLGRLYQENTANDKQALSKGVEIYLGLLRIEPSNTEAAYQAAYLLLLQGSYEKSLNWLERLPETLRQRAQVLAIRCAAEDGLGRRAQAKLAAEELLKSPELAESDVMTIQPTLAARKDWQLETTLLEALVARQMASFDSLVRLAALYEEHGKLSEARQTLEKAASASPLSVRLLLGLAQVAYKQGDRKGALGYLAHARDLDPKNAAVHFFFGIVCIEMDLPVEAEKSLKEAVTLSPENAYYNYALGAVTAQVRKWDSAIPYFQKYVNLRPDDPRGKLALGIADYHAYQEQTASVLLREVADNPQTAAEAHLYLARLALRQEHLPIAEQELEAALKANPNNADAYAELGFVYVQQERYDLAHQELMHALKLQPDGVRANMTLFNLYHRTHDKRESDQSLRVRELIQKREENAKELLRTIEVRPY
ncbi:MAG: tetratricopeptide repeat protein [Bryobacteraceae bacterium]